MVVVLLLLRTEEEGGDATSSCDGGAGPDVSEYAAPSELGGVDQSSAGPDDADGRKAI